MPTSLGQSWLASTVSLQGQERNCLTVAAPFPATVSSSDEESSSSLLSAFAAELVARERLAAAQERATRHHCVRASLIEMDSGLQKGPRGQDKVPSHICPNRHCPCDRQVLPSSTPSFSPPASQGNCGDLHISKGWPTADEMESKRVRHSGSCQTTQTNTSHTSCAGDLSPPQPEGPGSPAQLTGPFLTHEPDPPFAGSTRTWDEVVLHSEQR